MTATPYTMTATTSTAVFARKDRAVAAGEATGESFTVTSPKGAVVHTYTAPVVEQATATEMTEQERILFATFQPHVSALARVVIKDDEVAFYTASGRNIPVLEAGSPERTTAEAIDEARRNGMTVQQAADASHVSKATARRLINALALTLEVQAMEVAHTMRVAASA